MEETLRVLICVGFALLLVLLRLDAARFGVAEYLDDAAGRPLAVARRRLSWYILGLAFAGAILFIHPDAGGQLGLRAGDAGAAILAGLAAGAVGAVEAAGVALWRYGALRLPESGAYGWGLLDSVGTALVDEIAFRGVILGLLLAVGLDPLPAIVVQTLVYALATRTGAPGRDPYLLGLALAIGLLGGWLTVATGGIGAAVLGHAITRFAVFAFVGRAEPAWTPADAPRAVVDLPDAEAWPSIGRPEPGAPSR